MQSTNEQEPCFIIDSVTLLKRSKIYFFNLYVSYELNVRYNAIIIYKKRREVSDTETNYNANEEIYILHIILKKSSHLHTMPNHVHITFIALSPYTS